jgi:hypothetical protein
METLSPAGKLSCPSRLPQYFTRAMFGGAVATLFRLLCIDLEGIGGSARIVAFTGVVEKHFVDLQ